VAGLLAVWRERQGLGFWRRQPVRNDLTTRQFRLSSAADAVSYRWFPLWNPSVELPLVSPRRARSDRRMKVANDHGQLFLDDQLVTTGTLVNDGDALSYRAGKYACGTCSLKHAVAQTLPPAKYVNSTATMGTCGTGSDMYKCAGSQLSGLIGYLADETRSQHNNGQPLQSWVHVPSQKWGEASRLYG